MLVEVQAASHFYLDGVDQPQPIGVLFLLLPVQRLEENSLSLPGSNNSYKGLAVNMGQPHGLPKEIASFLILNLIVRMQH